MTDRAPRLLPVATVTFAYLAAALGFAISRGNLEFLLYIVVMLVLIVVVWVVHMNVHLNEAVLWALCLWGFAHMAGGLVVVPEAWPTEAGSRVLYSLWIFPGRLKYDHIVHAYGFGTTTWVCWQGLRAAISSRGAIPRPTPGLMVLSAGAGMGFGALNELVEFVATLLLPETNVGGYLNTGWDLVANLTGAVVAVALISLLERDSSGFEVDR
jgi:hypothetical protein